jgi:hypothetical protein
MGRRAEAHGHLSAVKTSGRAGLSTAADLDVLLAYCASTPDGNGGLSFSSTQQNTGLDDAPAIAG